MYYDNWFTPLSIQIYPNEIIEQIWKNTDGSIISVLDIGGNVGQFSVTIAKLTPVKTIDVFEPNPYAYELLKLNTAQIKKISIHNFGIGPDSQRSLHFVEGRSAVGSLLQENAGGKGQQSS